MIYCPNCGNFFDPDLGSDCCECCGFCIYEDEYVTEILED